MSAGSTLFLTVGIILFIAAVLHYKLVYEKNKLDKKELPLILENLDRSINFKDEQSVDLYGKQLIYNKYVNRQHLNELSLKLDKVFGEKKSLEELRSLIFNKQHHWKNYRGGKGHL